MTDVFPFWLATTTTEVPRPVGSPPVDQHVMVLCQASSISDVQARYPDAQVTGPYSSTAAVESARWKEIQRHRLIGQEVAIGAPGEIVEL